MNERTEQLRDIMSAHRLSAAEVGEILNRNPQTVRVWRSKYDARIIPADALNVLKFTLLERGAKL